MKIRFTSYIELRNKIEELESDITRIIIPQKETSIIFLALNLDEWLHYNRYQCRNGRTCWYGL